MAQEIAALDQSNQTENQELTLLRQQVSTYAAQMAAIQVKFNSLQQATGPMPISPIPASLQLLWVEINNEA